MSNPNPLIISFLAIRRAIGFLGILLPAVLLLGTLTIGRCTHVQESVSHYYYTIMGDVLVGILCAVSLFLLCYKGYDLNDRVSSLLAGVFALGIAFFAASQNTDAQCSLFDLEPNRVRIAIHFISATLFFITLSYISLFLFTKSSGLKTERKKTRNRLYRTCGVIMIAAIGLIALIKFIPSLDSFLAPYKPVFWLEWIALAAFGTSWLVKGKFMLTDKEEQ